MAGVQPGATPSDGYHIVPIPIRIGISKENLEEIASKADSSLLQALHILPQFIFQIRIEKYFFGLSFSSSSNSGTNTALIIREFGIYIRSNLNNSWVLIERF